MMSTKYIIPYLATFVTCCNTVSWWTGHQS